MANALGTLFSDIADAIRGKTGDTGTMKPAEFPAAITGISVGSGGGESSDLVKYVTFMNGNVELYRMPVLNGDTCKDPVTTGKISKPTKASTEMYNYTYANGWSDTDGGSVNSNILKNITEDKTVYATFKATVIPYTVMYYDGETLVYTETLWYGAVPTGYTPSDKVGYKFEGWDRPFEAVTGNTSYYAQWREANRLADYTWTELSAMSNNGTAKDTFTLGDTKTFTMGGKTMTAELIGFDGYRNYTNTTQNDTTTAGMAFWMTTAYEDAVQFHSGDVATFVNYYNTDLFAHISELLNDVEEELRNAIVPIYPYKVNTGTYGYDKPRYLWQMDVTTMNFSNYTPSYEYYEAQMKNVYPMFRCDTVQEISEARKRKSSDGSKFVQYWLPDCDKGGYFLDTKMRGSVITESGEIIYDYTGSGKYAPLTTDTAALVLGFCI